MHEGHTCAGGAWAVAAAAVGASAVRCREREASVGTVDIRCLTAAEERGENPDGVVAAPGEADVGEGVRV